MENNNMGSAKETKIDDAEVKKELQELERTRLKLITMSNILHKQNADLGKSWKGEGGTSFLNASVSQENAISNHIKAIENLMAGIAGTLQDIKEVDGAMDSLLDEVAVETEAANNGV
ncbi:hypothetical protein [Anaerosacchariphilus polymeriproducens]|uniref:WXG100 family type VII secretion target n=1 Tax=Anaerosacchariphilus polymeriproducens TaxID=1812858 RepID=A0A371AX57_9FIRM|nr:hypothetical protein [Anaerosacchariphilus polymeriproducens]RDU24147.1 hypothetical protein DWV06_05460 [Anaerosacchariphilus polymeriproducens]